MPPSPIPAPLPPWARVLLQVAPFIQAGLQEVLQYIGAMQHVAEANTSNWRHIQIVFENLTNVEAADRWVSSLDLVNITGGQIDSSWNDADYTNVHTEISGMVSAYLGHMSTQTRCKEIRYYRRSFNPVEVSPPFAPSGPPERVYTVGTAGSVSSTACPRQVAMSMTEKTPYPRHWGRTYWPAPVSSDIASDGHFVTASVDGIGGAMVTRFLNLQTKEFFPVVPVTQIQGAPARALLGVTQLQIDDVPDVIRRRRPSITGHRFVGP